MSSELAMRQFITSELPNLSVENIEDVIMHIGFAREQYSRYEKSKKATNGRFTYKSKKASCRRMMAKIVELKDELLKADLMLMDEMHDYTGSEKFQYEVTAQLDRLSTTCEVLLKTVPSFVETGRPVNRILYDWVLNMIRIYEDLFKPKKIDYRKNGKFIKFLKCWNPDGLPPYGDPLSPRTIQRILEFRKHYKEDLRNTFKPTKTYSSKLWADKKKGILET